MSRTFVFAAACFGVGSSACSGAEQIEVPLHDAKSALLVTFAGSGGDAQIEAVEVAGAVYAAKSERELYAVPYGCTLERLGLAAGAVSVAIDEQRPLIPRTKRRILHAQLSENAPITFDERAEMPDDVANLHLLADGVAEACCPARIVDGKVALTFGACQTAYCEARVSTDPDTCTLSIDPAPCRPELGLIAVHIETNGAVTATPPPSPAACTPVDPPRPYADASFDCTAPITCPIDLRLPREPAFTAQLTDAIPGAEPYGAGRTPASYAETHLGYLADLAVLQSSVVIASYAGRALDELAGPLPETKLHFIDPETMEETQSRSVEPGTFAIARDPSGDGLLTAHAVLDETNQVAELFVVRRDASGELLVLSEPIAAELAARPLALFADVDPPHAVYLAASTTPPKIFVLPSLENLVLADVIELPRASPGFANVGPDGDVAWVEDGVRWIDDLRSAVHLAGELGEPAFNGRANVLAVPSLSAPGGMYAVRRSDRGAPELSAALPYELNAGFTTAAPWPADQALSIAGGIAGPRAVLMLYAPIAGTYVPGALAIGAGPVRRLSAAPGNRVFAILPWTGQLVRITANFAAR